MIFSQEGFGRRQGWWRRLGEGKEARVRGLLVLLLKREGRRPEDGGR
jgi:hypothetical protein